MFFSAHRHKRIVVLFILCKGDELIFLPDGEFCIICGKVVKNDQIRQQYKIHNITHLKNRKEMFYYIPILFYLKAS